jgi:phage head maturation protease
MALQGRATQYNTITPFHHGARKLIMPNAFDESIESGIPIRFMLGQHDGPCVGTTWDALDLFSDLSGLAFRFRFPDTALGNEARAIAATSQNSEMSIGFDYVGARKESRVIDGLPVKAIIQAWLYEITWLHGFNISTIKSAFASYVNVDNSTLKQDCEGRKMQSDGRAVEVTRAFQKLRNALEFS